ncbi:MAG TPA: hypothetical protein VMZ52_08925 [Bryobacteraceae bacterium]|nr:hypothetical protein [Bryobacteraceae bacterium]
MSRVEYRVRFSFFDAGGATSSPVAFPSGQCIGPRPSAGPPGIVCVGGECHLESFEKWLPPGDIQLSAIPYDGYVFTGWFAGGAGTPFLSTYKVTGPVTLIPRFAPGKRVQVITDPPQLRVLVDRTEVITSDPKTYVPVCSAPGFFDFAEGSTHVLSALSPQFDINNKQWVFDSWSNGGGQNMVYKAERANVPEVLVAKFIPGIVVSLGVPPGLKLTVDGQDTWPSYTFVWGAGTKHVVTAPAEQTDQNGRKYLFQGWSNGGPATQELKLDTKDLTGLRLTAEYKMLGMLLVQSNNPVNIQVGDETCTTPCTLHREMGSELRIVAPQTVPVSEGSRLDLVSLGGDTGAARSVKLGSEPVIVLANYRPAYRVSAVADPPNGAVIRMEPASPDAFYPANTRVQVFSTSRLGYRFKRWEGDTADRFSPATVIVSGPLRLRAVLEAIAEISKTGVRNAAGETPVNAVAPGSIISIYGANLAPATEVGPGNPLAQTLAGLTVDVAGHILPLFFVSPEQINAQLPYDLPAGTQTLTIRNRDSSEVNAAFEVVRNAPGLITSGQGGKPVAVVRRSDGSMATANNPVKPGEIVTLFGTGFGPHRVPPPEGFGVEESDGYRLLDAVQIGIGDQTITPDYAGAAAGLPGVVALRFRVPSSVSAQAVVNLTATINGVNSNTVILPTAAAYVTTSIEDDK